MTCSDANSRKIWVSPEKKEAWENLFGDLDRVDMVLVEAIAELADPGRYLVKLDLFFAAVALEDVRHCHELER